MPWVLRDEEFEAILKLPSLQRYHYFIKRAAESERVWGLVDDEGWVSAGDGKGSILIPFWPHARFAAACANGAWAGTEPESVDIHDFMSRWIPEMVEEKQYVAIFPTPADGAAAVNADTLENDLCGELEKYL